jgi:hypothetical protein
MTIETMKMALEALEQYTNVVTSVNDPNSWETVVDGGKPARDAIAAIKQALAAPVQQEPWNSSDTAYRPEGLPQDFIKHEVDSFDDWSEWVCPDPEQYFMQCCDCGLVHEMQFNVVKYSAGDKCEDVDDPYVQAVFRARRTTPPAAPVQPVQPVQEPRHYRHTWGQDGERCVVCGDKDWMGTSCKKISAPAAQQEHDAYGYAKRLAVAIWGQHYRDVAPQWKPFDDLMGVLTQIDNMTSGLTTQRQPQYNKTEMNCFVQNLYDQKMREGKHGHYETMFHVVHRAIEAAHGIKEKNT